MTANHQNVVVVEIDGLYFRFQRMRNRRSSRGLAMLCRLIGQPIVQLIASETFGGGTEEKQLEAIARVLGAANLTGGKATIPDEFEAGFAELCHYSGHNGGEGVSIAEDELESDGAGWMKLVGLATLDRYPALDHMTTLMILWEVIKLNYRPTSAGSGTSRDTAPADATSSASDLSRPSGKSATTNHGAPTSPTPPSTGVTGL